MRTPVTLTVGQINLRANLYGQMAKKPTDRGTLALDALLSKSRDVTGRTGVMALFDANHPYDALRVAKLDADLNAVDLDGRTALHALLQRAFRLLWMARMTRLESRYTEFIRELLELGAVHQSPARLTWLSDTPYILPIGRDYTPREMLERLPLLERQSLLDLFDEKVAAMDVLDLQKGMTP